MSTAAREPGRALRLAVFGAALLLSLVVLFSPGSTVPSAPVSSDKVIHLVLFAVLAVAARGVGASARTVLLALVVYAGVSEVAQAALPIHRDGGWGDALTDVAGAVVGLAVVRAAGPRLAGVRPARLRSRPGAAPSDAPGTAGPTHR